MEGLQRFTPLLVIPTISPFNLLIYVTKKTDETCVTTVDFCKPN